MPKPKSKIIRLGGRSTPIKPKEDDIKPAFLSKIKISIPAEKRPGRKKGRQTSARRRKVREATRTIKRHPRAKAKLRTIPIDIVVTAAQSVRGTFEAGTFRTQDSEIIHFFEYDPVSKQLAVQLTAAGKWNWYTYQGVSPQTAANFESAPSKGQFFNAVIKKHSFVRGNALRGFQTISEI